MGLNVSIEGAAAVGGVIPVTQGQPSNYTFYNWSASDVPGVVAANNFVSLFNPVASGKTAVAYFLDVDNYCTAMSTTAASMQGYRITAASAGTLLSASATSRFVPTAPNPVLQIRTSNPTVTLDPVLTSQIFHDGPPVSGGAASGTGAATAIPPGASYVFPAGTGAVLQTPSGNTAQMWGFRFIWAEF